MITEAPPPPRDEIIIAAPSPHHRWERGHWVRRGHEWIWISGRWRA